MSRYDVNNEMIAKIGDEYDTSGGFLWKLRCGTYDPDGAARLLECLNKLDLSEALIDRELVKMIWSIPILIQWQVGRVSEDEQPMVETCLNKGMAVFERKLGWP